MIKGVIDAFYFGYCTFIYAILVKVSFKYQNYKVSRGLH